MKFAINLPNFYPVGDARVLSELAKTAEDTGWDGFFIWDHISRPKVYPMVDPWIALAAVALNTQHIRIGTMVTPLPRRRPWMVARQTVSLDHLSGGRLIFGAGTGGRPQEFDHLGEETDPRRRGEMLDEGLEILIGLWSGEPYSYKGKYYRVEDAHFIPPPLQEPRIPIWIGGRWPNKKPFLRAARWDGAFAIAREPTDEINDPPEMTAEIAAFIRQHRETDAPFNLAIHGITPGGDPQRAGEIVAPYAAAGATWWMERAHAAGETDPALASLSPLDAIRERIRQGPPQILR